MLKEELHIAVPTAFYKDESLNIQGTIDHINDLYDKGVKSVLISGSTGEQHSMSITEKLTLLHAISKEEKLMNDMEVIFGVASIRQTEAVELAKVISETSIAGIMLGYPPYIVPTQAEALNYSEKVIGLSNKSTIIYNNPKRTGFDLSIDSIIHLSKLEKVIGIKEAGDTLKVKKMKEHINDTFYYYAGGEVGLEDKIQHGFNRLSSITGNLYPDEIQKWFYSLLLKQDTLPYDREAMDSVIRELFSGSFIHNLKNRINENGIEMGICRSPLGNS